jgi:hypothetical protein
VQVVVADHQTQVLLVQQVALAVAEQALLVIQQQELLELPTLEVALAHQVMTTSTVSMAVLE